MAADALHIFHGLMHLTWSILMV